MTEKDTLIARHCEQRLAAAMMEAQVCSGDASVGMTAMINVFGYGLASLFETQEAAMAHLHMVLPEVIDNYIKGGAHDNVVIVQPVEAGHA